MNKTNSYVIAFPKGRKPVFIPDGMVQLYTRSYAYLPELQTLPRFPDSVTHIWSYAFYYCTGLTNVTIPDGVTYIGNYAFGSCSAITNVTMPDSITSINNTSFNGCTSITSVTIPQYVCSQQLSSIFPSY